MKNFNLTLQLDGLDQFSAIEIPDLIASSIVGGSALVYVEATAEAYGASTYTRTNARTNIRAIGRNGSIAFGRGTAIAIGDYSSASVSVFGVGDKVIEKTQTRSFDNGTTVSRGFVIVIDRP
jgi:ABC-type uncharacterized transport system permease subunit